MVLPHSAGAGPCWGYGVAHKEAYWDPQQQATCRGYQWRTVLHPQQGLIRGISVQPALHVVVFLPKVCSHGWSH